MINIAEPFITDGNIQSVLSALKSNSVSTYGPEVAAFEAAVTDLTSLQCLAVNSGTSALELSIDAVFDDLSRSKKRRVGFSDFTFIATSNAILNTSNIPVPLHCDPNSFAIDCNFLEHALKSDHCLDLVIITLPFGNYSKDVSRSINICASYGIPVILDGAACIALEFEKILPDLHKCESLCVSLNGNKLITSGAGGLVLTSKANIETSVREILSLHRVGNYLHSGPGQNKRMPALNASLGLSQLQELETRVALRKNLKSTYLKYLDYFTAKGFTFFPMDEYSFQSYWLYFLKPLHGQSGQELRSLLRSLNINSPPFWKPVSHQPQYRSLLSYLPLYNDKKVSYPDLVQVPISLSEPEPIIKQLSHCFSSLS